MHDYQRLRVWRYARSLAVDVYSITAGFPRSEVYGLTSQMRRASVSIAANLAEGAGRLSRKEFNRFVRIASGSACELETLVLIAAEVPNLAPMIPPELPGDIASVKRMLHQFEESLRP